MNRTPRDFENGAVAPCLEYVRSGCELAPADAVGGRARSESAEDGAQSGLVDDPASSESGNVRVCLRLLQGRAGSGLVGIDFD